MATDTEQLVLSISADTAQIRRALARLQGESRTATQQVANDWSRVDQAASRAATSVARGGAQINTSLRQVRASTNNLSFQLNDIAMGLASGTSPFTLMVQQSSQVSQAIQSMGGGMAAVRGVGAAFASMISPIALATTGLIFLAAKAVEYFTAVDEGSEGSAASLKEHQAQIDGIIQKWGDLLPTLREIEEARKRVAESGAIGTTTEAEAQRQYASLQEQITSLIPDIVDLQLKMNQTLNPQEAEGFRGLFEELSDKAATATASSEDLRRVSQALWDYYATTADEAAKATAESIDGLATEMDKAAATTGKLREQAEEAQKALDKVVLSSEQLKEAFAGLTGQNFDQMADSITNKVVPAIGQMINGLGDAMKAVGDLQGMVEQTPLGSIGPPITGGAGVFNPSQTQLENAKIAREEAERAAEAAAREVERATREGAREAERAAAQAAERLNQAIVNQTKVAVDAAAGLLGMSETANAAEINAFLKRGGVDLDAATTAWCAAFVNSALAQVGIKGSGSQVATSFMNWGQAVAPGDIRRGDVLVDPNGRQAGQTGGHVGFATGALRATADGITEIEMLSGNASNEVQTDWVTANDVIARRAAEAFVLPAEALNHLQKESQQISAETAANAKRMAEEFNQAALAFTSSFISDMMAGKSAAEALANALAKVGDMLLNMALQSLFSGSGGLGGLLFGGMEKGGVVGKDVRDVSRRRPSMWAGARRYQSGGMVGFKPGEVPIVAHRGELIIPKGGLRRVSTQANNNSSITNHLGDVSVDMSATGLVAAGNDQAKQFGLEIQKAVQMIMVAESRPGGLLRRAR